MHAMKQKYKISDRAKKDLTEIWLYTVKKWSRQQADRYVQGILDAFSEIALFPDVSGHSYDHVRMGYRKYPIGRHVIFYQIQTTGVVLISRILHEKMDYDRHL